MKYRQEAGAAWRDFCAELDAWRAEGRQATFWWRDDDAVQPGPALDQLFEIAGGTPISLAVIPADASAALAARIAEHNGHGGRVTVLQHGYAHRNHASAAEKKAEFGTHRTMEAMFADLAKGRQRLESLFGDAFAPVLTPPWNRIDRILAGRIAEAGLRGVSTYGPRAAADANCAVNTHIDIVDWRGSRGFVGEEQALGLAIAHLSARRSDAVDAGEPTGLLTHHLDHDAGCWDFTATFRDAVNDHPAACWVRGAADLAEAGA